MKAITYLKTTLTVDKNQNAGQSLSGGRTESKVLFSRL
jgi:hypothetical protein